MPILECEGYSWVGDFALRLGLGWDGGIQGGFPLEKWRRPSARLGSRCDGQGAGDSSTIYIFYSSGSDTGGSYTGTERRKDRL